MKKPTLFKSDTVAEPSRSFLTAKLMTLNERQATMPDALVPPRR